MPPPTDDPRFAPTPLGATLAVSFLASLGTGVVTNGVFFLTTHSYGFTPLQNYGLAVILGGTYVVAAAGAGRACASLRRLFGSSRSVLAAVLVFLGLTCFIPVLARLAPDESRAHSWTIWVMVGLFSPATGLLWPLVESFTSGGRRGEALRRTMGIWNTTWCGALIIAVLAMAPLVERYAAETLAGLGAIHIGAVICLRWFQAEPGSHDDAGEPHPPVYDQLLRVFRLLLPTSYVLHSTLAPMLATQLPKLELSAAWQVRMVAALLIARTVAFYVLGHWGRWHGRWWPVSVGAGALLLGFAGAVLTPRLIPGHAGIPLEIASLVLFGTGMAIIYSGAVYYAMEVGRAGVEAGGTHESLIGVGYTVGPLCPFAAQLAVAADAISPDAFEPVVLGSASLLAVAVASAAAASSVRRARAGRRETDEAVGPISL